MTFEKIELFDNKKELLCVFGVLILVFFLHVGYKFYEYKKFLHVKSPKLQGLVLSVYEKQSKYGKTYRVLKISTSSGNIYTTLWKKNLHVKAGDEMAFKISQKNVKFKDFLSRNFYAPSFDLHVSPSKTLHVRLKNFISNQHENEQMSNLYSTLFLATPLSKELRIKIQNWGISHLVAISGFHLGVIYGALFFIFKYIYGFFQNRFFPYRDLRFDLGILIFALLSFYTYLIDFTPSFLRAFCMSLLGFFFYMRYMKVLSFATLALSVAFLLALLPHLSLSIGFWFSVSGVFYIFLYLHHFGFRWWDGLLINIWVFLCMIVPVHFYFPYISFQQLGAVVLSLVFVVFYPFAFLLHVSGFGGVMDEYILQLLDVYMQGGLVKTPLWFLCIFVLLSLASIKNRFLAMLCPFLGLGYFFFI